MPSVSNTRRNEPYSTVVDHTVVFDASTPQQQQQGGDLTTTTTTVVSPSSTSGSAEAISEVEVESTPPSHLEGATTAAATTAGTTTVAGTCKGTLPEAILPPSPLPADHDLDDLPEYSSATAGSYYDHRYRGYHPTQYVTGSNSNYSTSRSHDLSFGDPSSGCGSGSVPSYVFDSEQNMLDYMLYDKAMELQVWQRQYPGAAVPPNLQQVEQLQLAHREQQSLSRYPHHHAPYCEALASYHGEVQLHPGYLPTGGGAYSSTSVPDIAEGPYVSPALMLQQRQVGAGAGTESSATNCFNTTADSSSNELSSERPTSSSEEAHSTSSESDETCQAATTAELAVVGVGATTTSMKGSWCDEEADEAYNREKGASKQPATVLRKPSDVGANESAETSIVAKETSGTTATEKKRPPCSYEDLRPKPRSRRSADTAEETLMPQQQSEGGSSNQQEERHDRTYATAIAAVVVTAATTTKSEAADSPVKDAPQPAKTARMLPVPRSKQQQKSNGSATALLELQDPAVVSVANTTAEHVAAVSKPPASSESTTNVSKTSQGSTLPKPLPRSKAIAAAATAAAVTPASKAPVHTAATTATPPTSTSTSTSCSTSTALPLEAKKYVDAACGPDDCYEESGQATETNEVHATTAVTTTATTAASRTPEANSTSVPSKPQPTATAAKAKKKSKSDEWTTVPGTAKHTTGGGAATSLGAPAASSSKGKAAPAKKAASTSSSAIPLSSTLEVLAQVTEDGKPAPKSHASGGSNAAKTNTNGSSGKKTKKQKSNDDEFLLLAAAMEEAAASSSSSKGKGKHPKKDGTAKSQGGSGKKGKEKETDADFDALLDSYSASGPDPAVLAAQQKKAQQLEAQQQAKLAIQRQLLAQQRHDTQQANGSAPHHRLTAVQARSAIRNCLSLAEGMGHNGTGKLMKLQEGLDVMHAHRSLIPPVLRAELLCEIGEVSCELIDFERAKSAAEEALEAAKEAKNPSLQMMALLIIGKSHESLVQPVLARNALEQLLSLAQQEQDEVHEAWAFCHLGTVLELLGHFSEAFASYAKSQAIALRIGDRRILCEVRTNVGVAHLSIGELGLAERRLTANVSLSRAIKDEGQFGRVLSNLSYLYTIVGNTDRAKELQQLQCDSAEKHGDLLSMAQAVSALGITHKYVKSYDDALNSFTKELRYATRSGLRYRLGEAYANIGATQRLMGLPHQAFETHRKELGIARSCKESIQEAKALGNIADVYAEIGRYNSAVSMYEQSLNILEELDPAIKGTHLVKVTCTETEWRDCDGLESVYMKLGLFDHAAQVADRKHLVVLSDEFEKCPATRALQLQHCCTTTPSPASSNSITSTAEDDDDDFVDPADENLDLLFASTAKPLPVEEEASKAVKRPDYNHVHRRLVTLDTMRSLCSRSGFASIVCYSLQWDDVATFNVHVLRRDLPTVSRQLSVTPNAMFSLASQSSAFRLLLVGKEYDTPLLPHLLASMAEQAVLAEDTDGLPSTLEEHLETLAEVFLHPVLDLLTFGEDDRSGVCFVPDGLLQNIPFHALPLPTTTADDEALSSRKRKYLIEKGVVSVMPSLDALHHLCTVQEGQQPVDSAVGVGDNNISSNNTERRSREANQPALVRVESERRCDASPCDATEVIGLLDPVVDASIGSSDEAITAEVEEAKQRLINALSGAHRSGAAVELRLPTTFDVRDDYGGILSAHRPTASVVAKGISDGDSSPSSLASAPRLEDHSVDEKHSEASSVSLSGNTISSAPLAFSSATKIDGCPVQLEQYEGASQPSHKLMKSEDLCEMDLHRIPIIIYSELSPFVCRVIHETYITVLRAMLVTGVPRHVVSLWGGGGDGDGSSPSAPATILDRFSAKVAQQKGGDGRTNTHQLGYAAMYRSLLLEAIEQPEASVFEWGRLVYSGLP